MVNVNPVIVINFGTLNTFPVVPSV